MRRNENKIRDDRNEHYIPMWEVEIGMYDCCYYTLGLDRKATVNGVRYSASALVRRLALT